MLVKHRFRESVALARRRLDARMPPSGANERATWTPKSCRAMIEEQVVSGVRVTAPRQESP